MSDVKYDKILGALRENDESSGGGDISSVIAGHDFVSAVNAAKPFPTNWDPSIIEMDTLSEILLKIMWRFDEDEQKNAIAHAEINGKISGGGGGVDTSILMVAPDYSNARFLTPNTDYVIESNGYLICTIIAGYLVDLLINRCQFINDGFLEMHETYPVAKGDIVRVSYADIPERETILFVPCKTAE